MRMRIPSNCCAYYVITYCAYDVLSTCIGLSAFHHEFIHARRKENTCSMPEVVHSHYDICAIVIVKYTEYVFQMTIESLQKKIRKDDVTNRSLEVCLCVVEVQHMKKLINRCRKRKKEKHIESY